MFSFHDWLLDSYSLLDSFASFQSVRLSSLGERLASDLRDTTSLGGLFRGTGTIVWVSLQNPPGQPRTSSLSRLSPFHSSIGCFLPDLCIEPELRRNVSTPHPRLSFVLVRRFNRTQSSSLDSSPHSVRLALSPLRSFYRR